MKLSVPHKMLRISGMILVVLIPVMISLWVAHIHAVKDTRTHLRAFARQALNKTDLVIQQADSVRRAAENYRGTPCTPQHRAQMLNIVHGSQYVADLIYAEGNHFL